MNFDPCTAWLKGHRKPRRLLITGSPHGAHKVDRAPIRRHFAARQEGMPMSGETFAYQIEGDAQNKTVVFIHGWPDDGRMWEPQSSVLRAHYRCVLVTLPNFGERADKPGGYDFAQLVEGLKRTLDEVCPAGEPVYLVTHDWGAYIGYLFERDYPQRVEKMVALDIGGHTRPTGFKAIGFIVGYQWTLIACWLLGGLIPPLGNGLARGLGRVLQLAGQRSARIRSRFNYPYFYLWKDLLLPWRRQNLLRSYIPQCPVLFIYGERKPVMFHSEQWLETLESRGGRWEGVEGGTHWFMETHPEPVNQWIHQWFS